MDGQDDEYGEYEYDAGPEVTPGAVAWCGILLAAAGIFVAFMLGRERIFVWRSGFLWAVLSFHLAFGALALFRASRAVRGEDDEELHPRLAFTAAVLPAAGALLVLGVLGLSPLRLGFTTIEAVRNMGHGTVLEFVQTPLLRQGFVLPRLRLEDDALLPAGVFTTLGYLPGPGASIERRRGVALVRSFRPRTWGSLLGQLLVDVPGLGSVFDDDPRRRIECFWTILDWRGRVRRLSTPPGIDPRHMHAFGWSADGNHFAWRHWEKSFWQFELGGTVFILGEDERIRHVELSEPDSDIFYPRIRWIDDRLLLARYSTRDPEPSTRWTILSSEGEVVAELAADPHPWWRSIYGGSPGRIASLRVRQAGQAPEPPVELSLFNPATLEWDVRTVLDTLPETFGVLADGRLLWTDRPGPENGFQVTVRTASASDTGTVEIRRSCIFKMHDAGSKNRYPLDSHGDADGWAIWFERVAGPGSSFVSRLLACHIESGESRTGPLGRFDQRSIETIDGGILAPEGLIPFEALGVGSDRPPTATD